MATDAKLAHAQNTITIVYLHKRRKIQITQINTHKGLIYIDLFFKF